MDYYSEQIGFTTLGWLESSPKLYRALQTAKANGEPQEDKDYFRLGSAIHCQLLEPEAFDTRYFIADFPVPTGKYADAIKHLASVEGLYNSNELEQAIELVELKGKYETVVNKLQDIPYLDYYNKLIEGKGKTILSPEESVTVNNCVSSIMQHKVASGLLIDLPFDNGTKGYNEFEIIWSYKDFKGILRSTLDRYLIDHVRKEIIIVDVKTTSKSINNFKYSYKNFKYYRQLAIYREALIAHFKEESLDYSSYTFKFHIIAVQTTGMNESRVFEPQEEDLIVGLWEFNGLLDRLDYHIANDQWNFPTEYYKGNGIEILKLDEAE